MPAGVSTNSVSYARVDNLAPAQVPTFINAGNFNTFPATIATNIAAGQYTIQITPVYADQRPCTPTVQTTPACPGLTSISGVLQGNILIVTYVAPSTVPKVRLTVNFPNGGSSVANYVNNGNTVAIGLPSGVYGDYTLSGQSVCDESSGFYSPASSTVTVTYAQTVSGTFNLGNTISSVCAAPATTLYFSGTFGQGTILYTDNLLSTPITGYSFVIFNGIIYNLSSTTGTVGTNTGQSCAPTVIIQNTLSFVNFSSVSGITGFIYSPSSGQNTQTGSHSAFTGSISVSWNGNVPSSPPFSIVIKKNGIQTGCNNFPTGSSSSLFTFGSDTYLATDIIQISASTGAC